MGIRRRRKSPPPADEPVILAIMEPDEIHLLKIRLGPIPPIERPFGGLVAWRKGKPIGLLVFRIERHGTRILFVSTRIGHRRRGIASLLLSQLDDDEETLFAAVPESNLQAQLLFRSLGYRCLRILGDEYHFTKRPTTP